MPPKKKIKLIEGQRIIFSFAKIAKSTADTVSLSENSAADPSVRPRSSDTEENEIDMSAGPSEPDTEPMINITKNTDSDTNAGNGVVHDLNPENLDPILTDSQKRNFQIGWLHTYPWLRYGNGLMFCKDCRSLKFANSMAQGTNNFRTSTLIRHVSSNDHQRTVAAPKQKKLMETAIEKAASKEEGAIQVAMKAVFWLCSENLPLSKYQSLISFLKLLKVPNIEHLQHSAKTNYSSMTSAKGFLQVLSDIIDESITQKINDSPVISLFTDESTDIVVNHKLAISVRVVNPISLKPSTYFLTDVRITSATGQGIFDAIKGEFDKRHIQLTKVFGLGTDGAAVMTGQKKGLTGLFLEQNPHMKDTHCSAHRVALISEQAADKVNEIKTFKDTITTIFYYFHKSPTKCDQLESLQQILSDPVLKYREVHAVRWLSFFKALETVCRTLDSLITFLEARSADNDAKATGVKKKVAQELFIKLSFGMMDWLKPIMDLSLFFQKKDIDIGVVKVRVSMCISELEKIRDNELSEVQVKTSYLKKLDKDLQNGYYKDHKVTQNSTRFDHIKKEFLQGMIENLQSRFPDSDFMFQFAVLGMKPLQFLPADDVEEWGNKEIEKLANFYTTTQQHKNTDGDMCTSLANFYTTTQQHKNTDGDMCTSKPLLACTVAEVIKEWTTCKLIVKSNLYPTQSMSSVWGTLAALHHQGDIHCPNIMRLASLALTHPVHTCDCERAFSVQNLTVTALRNRLSAEQCDQLMRVKIEGGEMEDFDFEAAARKWSAGNRRLKFQTT